MSRLKIVNRSNNRREIDLNQLLIQMIYNLKKVKENDHN